MDARPLKLPGTADHSSLRHHHPVSLALNTHNLPKMRVLGLPLVSLLLSTVVARDEFDFTDCKKEEADTEKCAQKIDKVVALTPGISYFSKISCNDCPYIETWNEGSDDGVPVSRIAHGDQELVSSSLLSIQWCILVLREVFINPTLHSSSTSPYQTILALYYSTAERYSQLLTRYQILRTFLSNFCIQTSPTPILPPQSPAQIQPALALALAQTA